MTSEHEKTCKNEIWLNLFDRLPFKERIYAPNENLSEKTGQAFEKMLAEKGGYDLMILGLGPNGHIGFNEPGSSFDSLSRPVEIAEETRRRYIDKFGGLDQVPRHGFTLGVKTILQAKKLLVIAFGASKAEPVYQMIHGKQDPAWVCSALQNHPDVTVVLDKAAARKII